MGRRFGRSRSSESKSEETVEGSVLATESAAIAAAIGQGDLSDKRKQDVASLGQADGGGKRAMGMSVGFGLV